MHFIFLSAFLLIAFHHAFSIPFESQSEDINLFGTTSPDSDFQEFSKTLTLNPTDLFSLSSPSSLFSANNNDYENSNSDEDLDLFLLSNSQPDNNGNCPLGKKRDTNSGTCDSSTTSPALPQLHFPGINDLINIGDQQGTQAIPANPAIEGYDPCALFRPGYPQHACCNGPPGVWDRNEYFTVEDCDPGIYYSS